MSWSPFAAQSACGSASAKAFTRSRLPADFFELRTAFVRAGMSPTSGGAVSSAESTLPARPSIPAGAVTYYYRWARAAPGLTLERVRIPVVGGLVQKRVALSVGCAALALLVGCGRQPGAPQSAAPQQAAHEVGQPQGWADDLALPQPEDLNADPHVLEFNLEAKVTELTIVP